jgi:hypothetical protein
LKAPNEKDHLHDAVMRTEGMAVPASDRKPGAGVEFCCSIEVADRVHDVVETVWHSFALPARPVHFTDENAVGTSN